MRRSLMQSCMVALGLELALIATSSSGKEFLTPDEILKLQDAQEIDKRIKIYMDSAALRLKTAEERLHGKESVAGDPLEFFTVEEMLDGYARIMRSVMFNLDEAAERPSTDRGKLNKALKDLKEGAEKAAKNLAIIKKIAEEKKDEPVWKLTNQGLEIAEGARDGAETGLERFPVKAKSKKR
jgi:hypothetical protein